MSNRQRQRTTLVFFWENEMIEFVQDVSPDGSGGRFSGSIVDGTYDSIFGEGELDSINVSNIDGAED
jgi:hypothetical protein